MNKIIGIDLGTTNSCMAVLINGESIIIPNAEGERTTPSVVAFAEEGLRLIGTPARLQQLNNPHTTISSIKHFMGRQWDEVSEEIALATYPIDKNQNGDVIVTVNGAQYAPQEISAIILNKLKTDAENYLGERVTEAVITVPAYFNDAQRKATKDAGRIAGLKVLRVINEPTAASLAYGLDKADNQTILVFDLGGGTFDVSILELSAGLFEVIATHGDNHLGGDNFDKTIVDWLIDTFKHEQAIDLATDPIALLRLYEAADAMGTTALRKFFTITLPGAKYGLISAVVFLYSPETKVASIAILNLDEAGEIGAAAAMAVLIALSSSVATLLFMVLARWSNQRTQAWKAR